MTTTKILVTIEHTDNISSSEVAEIVDQQVAVESDCYCDLIDEGNEDESDNATIDDVTTKVI